MRNIDFSSWQSVMLTLFGLVLVTLIGVGIRLVTMMTIQQRRERANRQINERLRVLIAAYKVLGGSFTGNLAVDPSHLRDIRRRGTEMAEGGSAATAPSDGGEGSDRSRRIRDAVEAALSDIILLGTETHVRLAEGAARALVEGRPVHTHDLVVALRDFIRAALDLDPVPGDLAIPMQGPTRPGGGGGGAGGRGKGGADDARQGGGKGGGGGRGGGGGGMGMGAGMGMGVGGGIGAGLHHAGAGDDPGDPGDPQRG
ncbi:hypothetical protein [Sphingomonas sp.]|uniref:hypothetical protein n=1 Tax=Sphingomonas sp. TaxID=28214 RepID=UPI002BCA42EB|nr:hypothetical protein [Sphingomonas sp.]HWK36560.1 hypothetical protein [Sphingomonas sp.]